MKHSPSTRHAAWLVAVWIGVRPLAAGQDLVQVDPDRLPRLLVEGWEAADSDPAQGVTALDGLVWRPADPLREDGPRGSVRWYRLRLDLSHCRGLPLAVAVRGIRDVDETYLDQVRVGGHGSFPPRLQPASMMPRLYPLPTDVVNAPGAHTLALRVYHGRRAGPVLSSAIRVERLAFSQRRWWVEQALAGLAGLAIGLITMFAIFYRQERDHVFLLLAGFTLLLAFSLLSSHFFWSLLPGGHRLHYRLATSTGSLLCLTYFAATFLLLRRRPPRRFHLYVASFTAMAVITPFVEDQDLLYMCDRVVRGTALVCVVEVIAPAVQAFRAGAGTAAMVLLGNILLGFGVVWQGMATSDSTLWFYSLCGVALALMGVGLYSLGVKQWETRFAAVLAERTRIAREIHDTLAQGFAGIAVQLESVDETLESEPEVARRHLGQARRLARTSLAEARRSVWELRPQALDDGPLDAALARLAGELLAGTGIRMSVQVRGSRRPLPARLEAHLFHIGREALANAMRHARPTRVGVEVCFSGEDVRLSVEDDGCGFEAGVAGAAAAGGHFGLVSMRERAEQIGGRLEIQTRSQQGTRVEVKVPLA